MKFGVDVQECLRVVVVRRQFAEALQGKAERIGINDGRFARLQLVYVRAEEGYALVPPADLQARFAAAVASKDHDDTASDGL